MGFDANVEFLRIAFWQIILAAGPLLAVALIVGLVIGIIQAATSINEMTLSFVPKLVIVVMTFGLLSQPSCLPSCQIISLLSSTKLRGSDD